MEAKQEYSRHVEIPFRNWIESVVYRPKSLRNSLGGTDMTICRDLIDLEKQGLFSSCVTGGPQKSKR